MNEHQAAVQEARRAFVEAQARYERTTGQWSSGAESMISRFTVLDLLEAYDALVESMCENCRGMKELAEVDTGHESKE